MSEERLSQQPQSGAKDFFAYLLQFVVLYTWVTSLGRLIFGFINVAFPLAVPGLADGAVTFERESGTLKLSFAILFITFPVFLLLARWINGELRRGAMRWESRMRKWLTYLTLFIASITVIIDVATLVYYFLSGDFTVRFLLKSLTVLLIGGGVFLYYLRDAKDPEENTKRCARPFTQALSFVVLLALGMTFFIADAPWVERAKRFDNQRVQDLSSIANAVQSFYDQRGALPTKITDLGQQGPWYVSSLVDPESATPYEYATKGAMDYELCATFARDGGQDAQPGIYPVKSIPAIGRFPGDQQPFTFSHGAGRTCFDRKVYQQVK